MRRKTIVILALVLVFALIFTACAYRRPLQTPTQPGQNYTGQYNYNRGVGTGAGTGTTTGTRANTWPGAGAGANNPYDVGYGYGNNGIGYGGYGTTNNPGYVGNNNGMYDRVGVNNRIFSGSDYSPNLGMTNTGTATTQSDRIARDLETIPGVRSATVVTSGNTAYVGVDTDGGLTGRNIAYGTANDISTIKRQCAQRVKTADPRIQTVYVSTDANFLERLRRVGDGVRRGTAVSSFRNELNGLVRGLTPERL